MIGARILVENGDVTIAHQQDCDPFLEHAHVLRDFEQKSDWGRHTHKIPNVEIIKMLDDEYKRGNTTFIRLFSAEFDELFAKKIRSGDWEGYRVDRPALQVGFLGAR